MVNPKIRIKFDPRFDTHKIINLGNQPIWLGFIPPTDSEEDDNNNVNPKIN